MCIGGFLRGGGGRCRCLLSHKCLPSHRVPVGMRGVQPGGGVQAQRALLPRCLKCHLLGPDVNDFGFCVKLITGSDDVCGVSCGGLGDRLGGVFPSLGKIVPSSR